MSERRKYTNKNTQAPGEEFIDLCRSDDNDDDNDDTTTEKLKDPREKKAPTNSKIQSDHNNDGKEEENDDDDDDFFQLIKPTKCTSAMTGRNNGANTSTGSTGRMMRSNSDDFFILRKPTTLTTTTTTTTTAAVVTVVTPAKKDDASDNCRKRTGRSKHSYTDDNNDDNNTDDKFFTFQNRVVLPSSSPEKQQERRSTPTTSNGNNSDATTKSGHSNNAQVKENEGEVIPETTITTSRYKDDSVTIPTPNSIVTKSIPNFLTVVENTGTTRYGQQQQMDKSRKIHHHHHRNEETDRNDNRNNDKNTLTASNTYNSKSDLKHSNHRTTEGTTGSMQHLRHQQPQQQQQIRRENRRVEGENDNNNRSDNIITSKNNKKKNMISTRNANTGSTATTTNNDGTAANPIEVCDLLNDTTTAGAAHQHRQRPENNRAKLFDSQNVVTYTVEFALSGRAKCKVCKDPIEKDTLRLKIPAGNPSTSKHDHECNFCHLRCFKIPRKLSTGKNTILTPTEFVSNYVQDGTREQNLDQQEVIRQITEALTTKPKEKRKKKKRNYEDFEDRTIFNHTEGIYRNTVEGNATFNISTVPTATTNATNGGSSIRDLAMVEKLNTKQSAAHHMATVEGKNIFITGPAGVGKSVLLKHIMDTLKTQGKHYAVTSSTGISAVPLGGETFHRFVGCGIPNLVSDFKKCYNPEIRKKFQELDVLIIEEISMLSGEFLDYINDVVKKIKFGKGAMGGIQLILCGDFLQLSPIEMKKSLVDVMVGAGVELNDICRGKGFAFQSSFWKEANLEVVILDEVFRQNNDKFIRCLHEVRKLKGRKHLSRETNTFLRNCSRKLLPKNGILPTRLYATNRQVDTENNSELSNLQEESHFYKGIDFILADAEPKRLIKKNLSNIELTAKEDILINHDFFESLPVSPNIELRVGAQVMLVKNFIVAQGCETSLANGSRGRVVAFSENPTNVKFMGGIWHQILSHQERSNQTKYAIVDFLNGERVAIGFCSFECVVNGVGCCFRSAIPLKLAWAISIHKSQGMTLDYVKVDLQGVFAPSQAYVALSRASSVEGLELLNFESGVMRCDTIALNYYKNPMGKFSLWKGPAVPHWLHDLVNNAKNMSSFDRIKDKKFAFTADLGFDRDEVKLLITKCGGKVTKSDSVSGRTNFLVAGATLPAEYWTEGNQGKVELTTKYKKAVGIINETKNKSNLQIIGKDDFFVLFKTGTATLEVTKVDMERQRNKKMRTI